MSELIEIEGGSQSPRINIVFLHGLEGDAHSTWQRSDDDTFWPKWLLQDIPDARAVTVSYNANASTWRGSTMPFTDRAENLVANMSLDSSLLAHPIVLVGHSLGGIIIKQIMRVIQGRAHTDDKCRQLLNNVRLIVFIGTPHFGSLGAIALQRFTAILRLSPLATALTLDNENLRALNTWYRDFTQDSTIKHLVFSETAPTGFFGTIVGQSSSDPGIAGAPAIPIDADHVQICKPAKRADQVYATIKAAVLELSKYPLPPASDASAAGLALSPTTPLRRGNRMQLRLGTHKDILVEAAEDRPFTVLLCGPQSDRNNSTASLKAYDEIRASLEEEGFDVVLGEDAGVDDPRIKNDLNSLSNELDFIRSKCNAIVLIADSIGNWCELTLFSWELAQDRELRARGITLFILLNEEYSTGHTFFRRGPFAYANAFGKTLFTDFANFEPSTIVGQLQILRSVYAQDKRGRPRVAAS